MKTLNQLFAFALCVLTFSTVVAQKDTTNDHWRNAGINTWTQPSRSVGIGTNSPKEKLHIQGGGTHGLTFKSTGNGWGTIGNNYGIGGKITDGSANMLQFTSSGDVLFRANTAADEAWKCPMRINADGRVAIGGDGNYVAAADLFKDKSGAEITDYSLFVGKGIITEKVKVALNSTDNWADYVFEEDYNLSSLEEVEEHIEEHGHLHNTPSAKEIVKSGGVELGSITVNQQEKIEELFLHIIALNKQVKELKSKTQD